MSVRLESGESHRGRALILATGITDALPDIPGLAEHWGTTVLHCPYCHGWEVRDQRLGVLTTSPVGLHQALLIRQWSDDVTVFTAGLGGLDPADERRLLARGVRLVAEPVVEVLSDQGRLSAVRTADGGVVELDAVFTAGSAVPHDGLVAHLGLAREDGPLGSFLAVDTTGKTSSDRIWAVGNVVSPMANVPVSIAAGTMSGAFVNAVLVGHDFDDAVTATQDPAGVSASAYWEDRYAGSDRMWSGRVNATTAEVVRGLPPGDALDLGCGEGGDAVWLAEQGWRVTALDVSPTAVARGAAGAATRDVGDRITWISHDLSTWRTDGTFDLVTASFFHSTVVLPRTTILRRAADQVRDGGHLLLVSHVFETEEDYPPWADRSDIDNEHNHDHGSPGQHQPVLLTPSQEIAELGLDPAQWTVELEEIRRREATGPDGKQTALLKDGVVLLRRTCAQSSGGTTSSGQRLPAIT